MHGEQLKVPSPTHPSLQTVAEDCISSKTTSSNTLSPYKGQTHEEAKSEVKLTKDGGMTGMVAAGRMQSEIAGRKASGSLSPESKENLRTCFKGGYQMRMVNESDDSSSDNEDFIPMFG